MLTQSVTIAHEQDLGSREGLYLQKKPSLLVRVVLFLVLTATILILGVAATARAQPLPQLPELPPAYLPGSLIPKEVSCTKPNGVILQCSVEYESKQVYFNFDARTSSITNTFIPARDYMIGQLVAEWGRPTGITRRETMVHVHWGSRSALIYTRDFQPNDPVEFILYDLEPLPASPWRGFGLFD